MSQKRKNKNVSIVNKYKSLMELDDKENPTTQQKIADKFGVSKAAVSSWVNEHRDQIIDAYNNRDITNEAKRIRRPMYHEVDLTLFEWFKEARTNGVPITGVILKSKAEDYAVLHLLGKIQFSDGWIDRWKKRHQISCVKMNGESEKVNMETVDDFKQRLSDIVKGYSANNIFNADETGLFFRCMPTRTLNIKGLKCFNGEQSKERLSILFCCSLDGEKLPPLVIGKSANPRALKGFPPGNLGVIYRNNRKAWMTGEIFSEWLLKIDRKFRSENRKILLFLDNFSGHNVEAIAKLTNVKVVFFPANCTSKLQPLDQGIIANFKYHYRSVMVERLILELEATNQAPKTDVKDAIELTVESWTQIDPSCISNCFRKCGFPIESIVDKPTSVASSNQQKSTFIPSRNPQKSIDTLVNKGVAQEGLLFADYASCDEDISISYSATDQSLVDMVRDRLGLPPTNIHDTEPDDDENETNDVVEPEQVIPTKKEAIDSLHKALNYFQSRAFETSDDQKKIYELLASISSKAELHQSSMFSYLQKL